MKRYMPFLPFLIFLFISSTLLGQGRCKGDVYGVPDQYARPIDKLNLTDYRTTSCKKRSRTTPWVVYSDRVGNSTYNDPNEGSGFVQQIDYKDWFFVTDERDEWIKIAKGTIEKRLDLTDGKPREYGWIQKSNMLLWNKGLIDSETFITQKAFLLNKAENIECIINKTCEYNLARIYNHPYDEDKRAKNDKTVYEFYFILKKEGDRYLLSKAPILNKYSEDLNENLIGWVPLNKLTEWKTRIALEPNFMEGYPEREKDPSTKRLKAFGDIDEAEEAISGKGTKPFWDYDPVYIKDKKPLNSLRYNGSVVRFPLLANNASNTDPKSRIISSGVIGEINLADGGKAISEIEYGEFEKGFIKLREGVKKYDVVFVVEGSSSMLGYKETLAKTIPKIGKFFKRKGIDARYGVVIHRDYTESQIGVLNTHDLNPSAMAASKFIQNAKFNELEGNRGVTSLRHALTYGLNKIGLDSEMLSSKMIFVIGSRGDIGNVDRDLCKEVPKCREVLIGKKTLLNTLAPYKAHLTFIQPQKSNNKFFQKDCKKLLEELGMRANFDKTGLEDILDKIEIEEPTLKIEDNKWTLLNSQIFGSYMFSSNSKISNADLELEIENAVQNTEKHIHKFIDGMDDVFKKGKSADELEYASGGFTEYFLISQIETMSQRLKLPKKELFKLVFQKKYKLYKEVYFPSKLSGSIYPLVTPVVFVSWNELRDFSLLIDDLDRARREGNLTKKKKEIENAFVNAYGNISGNYNTSIDDIRSDGTCAEDFHPVAQGIGSLLEGIMPANNRGWWKCPIKKVLKMKEGELNKFLDAIIDQARPIKKIQRQKLDYEFAYLALLSDNLDDRSSVSEDLIYYWIPIHEVFGQPTIDCKCK